MLSPILRLSLIVFNILIGIYFYSLNNYILLFLVFISTALLVFGYFRNGTVYAAFHQLKKGNIDKAEKTLSKTKYPDRLAKIQKAYYHFVKGFIASEKKEWERSVEELSKALSLGLKTENDTSIAILNIANTEFKLENYDIAQKHLKSLENYTLNALVNEEKNSLMYKVKKTHKKISQLEQTANIVN